MAQENGHAKAIAAFLDEMARDKNFSLSVAVAHGDKVVYSRACGYASREHKIPANKDTRYNIASIGKMFTAVAILQLMEQGKLDLNTPVSRYLPNFPYKGICDSVTIHQLLSHSSGLPLWFNSGFAQAPKFAWQQLKDYLPLFSDVHIDTARVGKYAYSNVGYFLLGCIIEQVSGITYKEYVTTHVFEPAGMARTGLWQLTEIIPGAATGYQRPATKTDWWKTNYHKNLGSCPAGGAWSSPGDLLQFYSALRSGKLLHAGTWALMCSAKVNMPSAWYGYGIYMSQHNLHPMIGHAGEFFGIRGDLIWYKDADYTVAILANSDQTDYNELSLFMQTELAGTSEDRKIYNDTRQLAAAVLAGRVSADNNRELLPGNRYSEELLQIKGYYYLNNNDFAHARAFFSMNALLSPTSESAKSDLERLAQKEQN